MFPLLPVWAHLLCSFRGHHLPHHSVGPHGDEPRPGDQGQRPRDGHCHRRHHQPRGHPDSGRNLRLCGSVADRARYRNDLILPTKVWIYYNVGTITQRHKDTCNSIIFLHYILLLLVDCSLFTNRRKHIGHKNIEKHFLKMLISLMPQLHILHVIISICIRVLLPRGGQFDKTLMPSCCSRPISHPGRF